MNADRRASFSGPARRVDKIQATGRSTPEGGAPATGGVAQIGDLRVHLCADIRQGQAENLDRAFCGRRRVVAPLAPARRREAPRRWFSPQRGAAFWNPMAPVLLERRGPRATRQAFRLHPPWVGNRSGFARPRDVRDNNWPNATARAPVQREPATATAAAGAGARAGMSKIANRVSAAANNAAAISARGFGAPVFWGRGKSRRGMSGVFVKFMRGLGRRKQCYDG